MKHPFNHVRTYRKRHALTSGELAFLIGCTCRTVVAHLESGRAPSLRCALALQAVLGAPPSLLFPGLYEHAQEGVVRRSRLLREKLRARTDRGSDAKRDLLDAIERRAEDSSLLV